MSVIRASAVRLRANSLVPVAVHCLVSRLVMKVVVLTSGSRRSGENAVSRSSSDH